MSSSYQELDVWKLGVELAVLVYRVTSQFPQHELYGLTSQMRRASVAVASNIAEGQGRGSRKEFRQFLRIAFGSLLELETQVVIAERIGYLNQAEKDKILEMSLRV